MGSARSVWNGILFVVLLCLAAACDEARAERFTPVGARQRALGGAGVAATEDATSIYWNPANLPLLPLNRPPRATESEDDGDGDGDAAKDAQAKRRMSAEEEEEFSRGSDGKWTGYDQFQLQVPLNFELALTGDIVARLDDLDDLIVSSDVEGVVERAGQVPPQITQQDFQNLVRFYDEIDSLDDGGDGIGEVAGGLFFRYRGFGLALYTTSYAGLHPRIRLASEVGFSDTASVDQIAIALDPSNSLPPPQTAAGQQFQQTLVAAGISNFAARDLAYLAEQSGVDLSNPELQSALTLAAQLSGSGTANSIESNQTGAETRALSTQELAISFGIDFFDEVVSLGVTPKLMHGFTWRDEIVVADVLMDDQSFSDIVEEFSVSRESTLQFGIDAGVSLQPFSWLRLGAVGRNLNKPRFNFKDSDDTYELDPQFRAGIAIRPVPSIMLTVDGDIVENESSAVRSYESQQIGGGLEFNPEWDHFAFALRGGMYIDLKDESDEFRPVITGGIGLRVAALVIDVAGSMSTYIEEFRGYDIPGALGLAANIGLTW